MVSVIIPTHNRAELVHLAVQSAVDQTYENMEIIVIDDGSTDNTVDVLRKFNREIDYIYQKRSERSKARNRGVEHSVGTYIAFLDSDDLWLPEKIERQVQVLNERPDVGVVYTDVQFIDAKGNSCTGEISWDAPQRQVLYEDLMTHNVITGTTSSVVIRRECLDKVGLFDESMNTCEDLDLYRRLAQYYNFCKIEQPLVKFRIHGGNTQQNSSDMAKGWEATIRKLSQDTPPIFEYYKNEAIIKVLHQIASLHKHDGRIDRFFSFCLKSLFDKPNWILQSSFWKDLIGLCLKDKCKGLILSKSK